MPKVIVETKKPANEFITCMILILRYIGSKTHLRHILDRYGTDAKNYANRRFSYCVFKYYKHSSKCYCIYKLFVHFCVAD